MKKSPSSSTNAKKKERKRVLVAMDWIDFSVHQAIARYAAEKKWILNLHMMQLHSFPVGWKADGVLAAIDKGSPTFRHIRKLNVPTVDISVHHSDFFPEVIVDHRMSGKLAAQHLLEKGHRRFAFFFAIESLIEWELFRGLLDATSKPGLQILPFHLHRSGVPGRADYGKLEKWIGTCLDSVEKPVAVMVQDDETASIVLSACLNRGLAVPEQVAVIGSGNNTLICDFAPITISSVDNGAADLGYRAASVLDRLMNGEDVPRRTIVPPRHVVERGTTDFLAAADPAVLQALRFIWDNFGRNIDVDDVVRQVGVSRASLYRRFHAEIGTSIASVVTSLRLKRAKALLSGGDLPIGTVAKASGYSNLVAFSRAFLNATGMTASAFRKKSRGH